MSLFYIWKKGEEDEDSDVLLSSSEFDEFYDRSRKISWTALEKTLADSDFKGWINGQVFQVILHRKKIRSA